MKKFYLLTKTLLVAVCLLVGANAWGESQIFSEDFSGPSYNVTWGGTSAGGISPAVADGKLTVANGSQSGDRSAYVAFGSNAHTGCCRLTFDMGMTKSNWSGKNNNFYILPSATTDRYPSTTNAALIITQTYNGEITIAGESVGTYDGTILTYDLYLNTVTHYAKVIVKNGETTLKTISYATTATGINTLHLNFNKNFGAFAIDNISFYSLTAPDFTLSDDSKTVSVGESETVNVTNITGAISVLSNNTAAATASYDAGTITINGVASGVATITVTGTNDGLTIEKDIEVTVGEVATTTVTVNYLCGETPIAEALELTDVTVGSILTASDITYDEVIYGSGVRYVNPTPDQTIPYTVVEDGVININYTSQAAVTNVKKIVKAGAVTVSSTDVAQDGKYVGDVINFSYPAYINYNGTLYSKGANGSTYSQSFTLTATDQECILAYTATDITNVVYFSEGESVTGATATSAGGNMSARSSNQACGYAESDLTLINLPAGGYRISIVMYANSSAGATLHFQFGDEAWDPNQASASNWATRSTEFSLASAADVKWLTSGDSKNGLDFVYIQKTADIVKLNSSGYATYSAKYDVEVSGAKAYTAVLDFANSKITCTEIASNKVPAGKGVLLYGEADADVTLSITTGAAALGDNNLKATTQADGSLATKGSNNYYALSGDTFKKFTGAAFVHNKAYFEVTAGGEVQARSMRITFGGITEVENVVAAEATAKKNGAYLENGKIAIYKNGMKFNAAGAQMK